ncbi:MAG: hypothetical protein C4530_01970 [Desulfobacteraceae bacterium]|nr:MAG: hypothetical protein C4530_01970 [Desulfobacteraceae bacterium]
MARIRQAVYSCFQGPHFGDRYGIAQAVFQTLKDPSIPVLASEFSQSAVILALPGGAAEAAKERLSEVFQVPSHQPIQTPIQTIRSDKRE